MRPLLAAIVAVVLACVVGGCVVIVKEHSPADLTETLCSKERVAEDGGGSYRVYGARQTLTIQDSHWPGEWRTNSSDVYRVLQVPGRYRVHYIGFRWSLVDDFRNIMHAKRLDTTPAAQRQVAIECAGAR